MHPLQETRNAPQGRYPIRHAKDHTQTAACTSPPMQDMPFAPMTWDQQLAKSSHHRTLTLLLHRAPRHPLLLHLRPPLPQLLQPLPRLREILRRRPPIPPLRLLRTRRTPNAHLGEIPHRELRLRQPRGRGLARPEVGLGVALLEDALGAGQVPAAEGELALVLFLEGGFAVPGDGEARVDGAVHQPVFVGAAEAVLREFVGELGGLGEHFPGVGVVVGGLSGGVGCFVP